MKDFSYAQKKTQRENKRPWYTVKTKKWGYVYLWGLPLLPIAIVGKTLTDWNYKRKVWDENKATKALDYILPHKLEWVKEDNAYYYCMDWDFYDFHKYVPFYLKKWVAKFDYSIHRHLLTGYEKNGYFKTIEREFRETWVKFEKRA